mgnify:FL=1
MTKVLSQSEVAAIRERAAQGDLNWRAATMKLGKDEVTLRPTARAFLAVLEHEARVRAVPRQT